MAFLQQIFFSGLVTWPKFLVESFGNIYKEEGKFYKSFFRES